MRFLLSIHDVWPGNFPLVSGYLDRLRSLGAGRAALLIVPDFHGKSPIGQSGDFLAWLHEEASAGTEIFLHGFRHWMPELSEGADFKGKRSGWGRWVNRNLVDQEAEFSGLARPDQERLLTLGRTSFRECGIEPVGFVAPTWHGSPTVTALRNHGIRIRETRFRIENLESGASRFAPPLAWDLSRGGDPALFGGGAWLRTLLRLPLIKVAIHPGDFSGAGAERVLERVVAHGTASTYKGLFPVSV